MLSLKFLRENLLKEDLSFVEKWEKIQPLFSRILGLNFSFYFPNFTSIIPVSKVTPICADFIEPLKKFTSPERDCVFLAFEHAHEKEAAYFICPHGCYFSMVKKQKAAQLFGILILGPSLVGKRDPDKSYEQFCAKQEIHLDTFCDGLREMPLFSHQRIRSIQELCRFLMELSEP